MALKTANEGGTDCQIPSLSDIGTSPPREIYAFVSSGIAIWGESLRSNDFSTAGSSTPLLFPYGDFRRLFPFDIVGFLEFQKSDAPPWALCVCAVSNPPAGARVVAARIRSAPHAPTTSPDLALTWLDLEPQPRLICTQALELVWANGAAHAALGNGDDLELRDGVVTACERGHQQALCTFVRGCETMLSTLALPAANGGGHLLLRGRRLDPAGHVGLAYLRSDDNFRALHADLEQSFQLTPSEYRVLLRMIDGLTAEAIATATALSVETVRSHIRHLYAKMGVASREAMFAKTLPFRL